MAASGHSGSVFGTAVKGEDGKIHYKQSKVLVHTLFFVAGVSFAFFLLGLGVSAVGGFFHSHQAMFARVGGILVMLFGLYQLGIFGTSSVLGREHRLPFQLDRLAMSPVTALLMGFTFSFAWTPCVGPALTSVLLMAASASTRGMGFLLIGVYTVGFVLPFLAVGLFTSTVLEFFKSHGKAVRYTVKAGGVLMVLMGVLMFTGKMNSVTGYLSGVPADTVQEKEESKTEEENTSAGTEETVTPAVDFTLKDQYGNTHTLSEYKGKTVFLNFWATWCPPCKAEMPDIQKIYEEYQEKGDDSLVILGIAAPNWGQEQSQEGITAFLEEMGYTYPVVMDTTGEMFMAYGISSFPTTFMIDKEGNVFGYASGQLSEDMMRSIIRQTVEGKRE